MVEVEKKIWDGGIFFGEIFGEMLFGGVKERWERFIDSQGFAQPVILFQFEHAFALSPSSATKMQTTRPKKQQDDKSSLWNRIIVG